MALEGVEQQVNFITLGAQRLGELMNQGYSRDEAEMILIRDKRGINRQEALLENAPRAGERAREVVVPEERDTLASALKGLGIDIDNPNLGEQERVANPGAEIQFGKDQADWQIKAPDDKVFDNKERRRFQQQLDDKNPLPIDVFEEQLKGPPIPRAGLIPVGQPIPADLQNAAILQDMRLARPERRKDVPYKKGKDGKKRRKFARFDEKVGELKEFRVGRDGPDAPFRNDIGNGGAHEAAFVRLAQAVERGEIGLDDPIEFEKFAPFPRRNVGDVLNRMGLQEFPEQEIRGAEDRAAAMFREDRQGKRRDARAQLREIAIQRKAAGNPLSKSEAKELLQQLAYPKDNQDVIAGEKAERLRNKNVNYNREMREQNIGRIAEVKMLGAAKDVDKGGNVQRVVMGEDIYRGDAYPIVERAAVGAGFGQDVIVGHAGIVDGKMQELGDVNFPDSSNAVNAPIQGRGQIWAAENVRPMGKEGGGTFGPNKIDLIGPGRNFMAAAKGQFDLSDFSDDIRDPAEFEAVVDRIIELKAASGKPFMAPEEGDLAPGMKRRQVAVKEPGVADVIRQLRMPAQEQGRLADAIDMMRIQKARGINEVRRKAFREGLPAGGEDRNIIFEAPRLVDAEVPIAKVGNQKIKGKGVGAALRALKEGNAQRELDKAGLLFTEGEDGKRVMLPNAIDAIREGNRALPDARQALIGVAGGDDEPRAKFIKRAGRNMSPAERAKRFGGQNAELMNEVERRYYEDRQLREAAAVPQSDPLAQRQRGLDAEFAERGRQVELDKQAIEMGEIARLMRVGAQAQEMNGPQMFNGRLLAPGVKGRKLVLPNESELNQGDLARKPGGKYMMIKDQEKKEIINKFIQAGVPNVNVGNRIPENVFRKQPIQEAPTPSIAPIPGDITGNQPAPMNDAGRGGWMGGDNGGRTVNPWSSKKSRGGALVPNPGGELQGRSPVQQVQVNVEEPVSQERSRRSSQSDSGFRGQFAREMMNKGLGARTNREKFRNRAGVGAAAAAGVAGLAALIGGERDQREQEQYQ